MLIQSIPNIIAAFPASSTEGWVILRHAEPVMLVVRGDFPAGTAGAGVLVGVVELSSGEPVIVEPFAGRVGPPKTPDTKCPSVVFVVGGPLPILAEEAIRDGERLAKPTEGPGK